MNHTYKILKYLYKNNDGKEHPVHNAYNKNKLPSRELLWDKIKELDGLGYIKMDDDVHGLLDINRRYPSTFETIPDDKHTLYQIKITSKGEDYIDERTYNLFGIWLLQKRNGILILIGIVTAIINIIIHIIL